MTSYREAGVDLDLAQQHVSTIAASVMGTWSGQVVGGFGGFAAGVELPSGYRHPVLMMSTDGVGTKLEIARRAGMWSGVGFDLVAMCVDDLAATGAMPLGFVDYVAVGKLDRTRDEAVVESIARACRQVGCPLLGGETAEHPGVMDDDSIDLAGAAMGVVEKGELLGPDKVEPGDMIIGLASPNLRSNGFSLVRAVFGDGILQFAEPLLQPSVIYTPTVVEAVATGAVHAAAHITGGGIVANLSRALPDDLGASINRSWDVPSIFGLIEERGVSRSEMFRTFNMGIGFCLVVARDGADDVATLVEEHSPLVIGEIVSEPGIRMA